MALTISIEGLGVIAKADAATNDTGGDGTGDWGFTGSGGVSNGLTTDTFYRGTSSISMALSGAGKNGWLWFNRNAGLNFTTTYVNQYVYIWIHCPTIGLSGTRANAGVSVRLGRNTTNYRTWVVAGNDGSNGWDGKWKCFVIDPTKAGSFADTGTYDGTQVQYFGIRGETTGTAKGDNFFCGGIAVGSGLRITGTSTTGWADAVAYCTDLPNRAWGMLQQREGIYYQYGKINIGSAASQTADVSFTDSGRVLQAGISEYWDGSAWVTSAPTAYIGLNIEDHASWTTSFTDGVIVGSDNGRSGSAFIGTTNHTYSMDLYGGNNIGSLTALYGTRLKAITGTINSGNDADHKFLGCSFVGCSKFDPVGAPVIRNCTFSEVNSTTTSEVSYSGSADGRQTLYSGAFIKGGQTFQGAGGFLTQASFGLRKIGSPTGNMTVSIFAHSGTYGTSGVGTGIALATSNTLDVSTLTTSTVSTPLTFPVEQTIWLETGTSYVVVAEYSGGDVSNHIAVEFDNTAPTHTGNRVTYDSSWVADSTRDSNFSVTISTNNYGLLWNSNIDIQDCNFIANTYGAAIQHNESTVMDSYSESNQNDGVTLSSVNWEAAGQGFTGNGSPVDRATFYVKKTGSPTSTAVAKLYAHTGTFGTNGTPTGTALATSDTLDVSTLTTSYALTGFRFSTPYTTTGAVKYFIIVEYTGGDGSNNLQLGYDTSSPSHGGNTSSYSTGAWSTALAAHDTCFYVHDDTEESYLDLLFSGNTTDIVNTSTPANLVTVSKSGTSNPVTYEGNVIIQGSVPVQVNVVDRNNTPIASVQTAVYLTDGTEILNADTNASGIASTTYAGTTPANVVIKTRKSSTGSTKYKAFSTTGTIASGTGLNTTVVLGQDGIVT